MSTDPWVAGNYFSGQFVGQPQVQFNNPFRDQRLAIFIDIDGIQHGSLLRFYSNGLKRFSHFYISDVDPTLVGITDLTTYNDLVKRWNFIGGAPPPFYYVFTDENGDFRYLTTTFPAPPGIPALSASGTPPAGGVTAAESHLVGNYLDILSDNGTSKFRLTINSSNVISLTDVGFQDERFQTIKISSGHPDPYFSSNDHYTDAIVEMGAVDTQLTETELGYGGIALPRIEVIRITLHNNEYDWMAEQDWEGRNFTIRIGSSDEPFGDIGIAIRGQTELAEWNENTITLNLRDASYLLDRDLQENTYGGTGGADGDESVKGRLKPLLFGHAFMVEPLLIDEQLQLYQFHDGPIRSPQQVGGIWGGLSQGGVFLTNGGNLAGGLETWQPQPGEESTYRTDFDNGLVRLASRPEGPVVIFSVKGDFRIPTESRIRDVIEFLIDNRVPEISVDNNSFFEHGNVYFGEIGDFITTKTTIGTYINRLLLSCGSSMNLDRLGNAHLQPLLRKVPVAMLTDSDRVDNQLSRRRPPVPGKTYRFGYRHTHRRLSESELLGAADAQIRALGSRDYAYTEIGPFADEVTNRFVTSQAKEINTSFTNTFASDIGQVLADREYAFRDVYDITVENYAWQLAIGDVVLLQFSRWGMDVPRMAVIIGVTELSPTSGEKEFTRIRVWC